MSAARSVQRLLHRRGRLRGYDALHRAERLPPQCSLPHDRRQKPEPRMYSSKQGKALSHQQTKSEQGASFSNCQSRGALPTAAEAAAQPPIDLQTQQDHVSLGVDDRSHSPDLLVSSPLDTRQSTYRPETPDLYATRSLDSPSQASVPQMIPWRRRLRSRRLPSAQVVMESEQAVMRDRWSDYSQSVLRAAATPLPPDAPAMGFQPHWVLIWQVNATPCCMRCSEPRLLLMPRVCSAASRAHVCLLLCIRRRPGAWHACTCPTNRLLPRTGENTKDRAGQSS